MRQKNASITGRVRIANCGNAAAHDARFIWRSSKTGVEEEHRIEEVLPCGEKFKLAVHKLDDASFENLASTGAWSVVVKWRRAPNLKHVRRATFVVAGPIRERGRQLSRHYTLRQRYREWLWSRKIRRLQRAGCVPEQPPLHPPTNAGTDEG